MTLTIEIRRVVKEYSMGTQTVPALQGVSLDVEKGEFLAIMGRSGSGKSTLLRILGTLEEMTSGSYLLNGINVRNLTRDEKSAIRRQKIGFVFQKYQLLPEYTVWDNICMPLYLDHMPPDREYLEEILERFGIADKRCAYPEQLSGGQQQRAAIARALSHRPEIVLADEPTGNLDHRTGQEVMETLAISREIAGQTIVLVTHDNESASYADRILRMKDGMLMDT